MQSHLTACIHIRIAMLTPLQMQRGLRHAGLIIACVYCVSAISKLQELVQHYEPFPYSLILHSWSSSAEMVH